MRKYLWVVAAAIVLGITASGQQAVAQQSGQTQSTTTPNFTNVGSSGSVFTKLGIGARAAGLAGAFSGLANDISALYWNPAGIANLPGVNVGASTSLWFGGVTENFIGVTLPVSEKYRAGFALTLVDYGNLAYSTIQQDANAGSYNANDLSFAATIAGALTDRFSFGATAKYLRSTIYDMSATGIAFDAGSRYLTDFYHMTIAMDLTNLGPIKVSRETVLTSLQIIRVSMLSAIPFLDHYLPRIMLFLSSFVLASLLMCFRERSKTKSSIWISIFPPTPMGRNNIISVPNIFGMIWLHCARDMRSIKTNLDLGLVLDFTTKARIFPGSSITHITRRKALVEFIRFPLARISSERRESIPPCGLRS